MSIKLLMATYQRKVEDARRAEQAVAFMQAFVSMVDAQDYTRR